MYRQSPIAAGGAAPIITSRAIPPELPAAKDNTRTPKRSSLCLTPASAPDGGLMAELSLPRGAPRAGDAGRARARAPGLALALSFHTSCRTLNYEARRGRVHQTHEPSRRPAGRGDASPRMEDRRYEQAEDVDARNGPGTHPRRWRRLGRRTQCR